MYVTLHKLVGVMVAHLEVFLSVNLTPKMLQ